MKGVILYNQENPYLGLENGRNMGGGVNGGAVLAGTTVPSFAEFKGQSTKLLKVSLFKIPLYPHTQLTP